jgi:hypothetical protein
MEHDQCNSPYKRDFFGDVIKKSHSLKVVSTKNKSLAIYEPSEAI